MLLESVMAVYPASYRGVDDMRRVTIINEWQTSLAKYPAELCARAWQKYKDSMHIREMNMALFIGVIKDVQAADAREAMRNNARLMEPERAMVPHKKGDARDQCLEKMRKLFGREFTRSLETPEEYIYTYRCPKCMDTGIIAFEGADGYMYGRKCTCDYFDRQREEARARAGY